MSFVVLAACFARLIAEPYERKGKNGIPRRTNGWRKERNQKKGKEEIENRDQRVEETKQNQYPSIQTMHQFPPIPPSQVRHELKRVEGTIEDVGSSNHHRLDEIKQINEKYEARTKHLLDIIEQQQTKITKLTSELSMSDTQVMQLELSQREIMIQKKANSQDVLLRKKMVEAEKKKKKIIHRKMLRQQMEKRILEDTERGGERMDAEEDDDALRGQDGSNAELKKAREVSNENEKSVCVKERNKERKKERERGREEWLERGQKRGSEMRGGVEMRERKESRQGREGNVSSWLKQSKTKRE